MVRQFDLNQRGDGGDAGGEEPIGEVEGFEQRFFAQKLVLWDGLSGHGLCGLMGYRVEAA